MANEELVTQYNQLVWQMDQLRNEANEAGAAYATKLKAISKRMHRVTDQLDVVSRELVRRQVPIGPPIGPAVRAQVSNAGFHPTENTTTYPG